MKGGGEAHRDDDDIEPFVMLLEESFIVSSSSPLAHRIESTEKDVTSPSGLGECSRDIFEITFVQ